MNSAKCALPKQRQCEPFYQWKDRTVQCTQEEQNGQAAKKLQVFMQHSTFFAARA